MEQKKMETKEMKSKEITLHVNMNTKELFSFMMYHTYSSLYGLGGLAISIISFILLLMGYGKGDDSKLIILIIAALLFTVINPIILLVKAKGQKTSNPVYQNEMLYVLSDQGITVHAGNAQETVQWNKIQKWKKTKVVHMLYTTKINAILIPTASIKGQELEVEDCLKAHVRGK